MSSSVIKESVRLPITAASFSFSSFVSDETPPTSSSSSLQNGALHVDGILDFDAPFLRPSLSPSREKSRSLDARTVLGLGRASSRVLPFFFFCVGKDNKICRWRFSFGSV